MFEKIKKFYDMGLYTKVQGHKFVEKGVITEEQYVEIVGEQRNNLGQKLISHK